MARHTFVTPGLIFNGTKTVDILTRAEITKIVEDVVDSRIGEIEDGLKAQERKIDKILKRVDAAEKDAAKASKEVQRFVEKARETFREVIEEILEPHYRFLAQHLGIELPAQLTSVALKNRTASTRKTASAALLGDESISAKTKKKTTRRIIRGVEGDRKNPPACTKRKTASAAQKPAVSKKTATRKKSATMVVQSRQKGSRLCLK